MGDDVHGNDVTVDETAEAARRPPPDGVVALVAEVFGDKSILKGGSVALASSALATAGLVALDISRESAASSGLEGEIRKAAAATAAALVAEEGRHRHDPPPQIVKHAHRYVSRQLVAEPDQFDNLDELALFLFEQGARLNGLRKEKREKLIQELAWTLAGCCRAAGMSGKDQGGSADLSPDPEEVFQAAHELLAEDMEAHAEALESAASAIRSGRVFALTELAPALDWSNRVHELYRTLNGADEEEVSIASLEALLHARDPTPDPRRLSLEQLEALTSTVTPEPPGLQELRARASAVLHDLENDAGSEPELDALQAAHQIIAGGATAELVLSELLPRAIAGGLPPAVLVAPTLDTLRLPAEESPAPEENTPVTPVETASVDEPEAAPDEEAPTSTLHEPSLPSDDIAVVDEDAQAEPAETPAETAAGIAAAEVESDPRAEETIERPETPAMPDRDPSEVAEVEVESPANGGTNTLAERLTAPVLGKTARTWTATAAETLGGLDTVDADGMVAQAVLAERYSAAYWEAVAGSEDLDQFTVNSLRVTTLAAGLGDESGGIADELELALVDAISTDHPAPAELLYAAAAMRLILVKPYGVASEALREAARDLNHVCQAFATACAFVADRSASGALGDIHVSESVRAAGEMQVRRMELQERARVGMERWPLETQKYHPVNRIWSRWMTGSGELRKVLEMISAGSDDAEGIQAIRGGFVVRKSLDKRINEAYASVRAKRTDKLVATARDWLYNRVDRVLMLVGDWLELLREQHSVLSSQRQEPGSLQHDFEPVYHNATSALEHLAEQSLQLRAAVHVARATCRALHAHVMAEQKTEMEPTTVSSALNRDLTAVWEFVLDLDGKPRRELGSPDVATIDRVLDRDWLEVFEVRLGEGDHQACAIALEELVRAGVPDIESLERRREDDLRAQRARLARQRDKLRIRTSRLYACGALPPIEFERSKLFLDRLDPEQALSFPAINEDLVQLTAELDHRAAAHRATLESRLRAVRADETAARRLTQLLDEEQFDVADELIAQLGRGEPLAPPERREDLLVAFKAAIEGLTDATSVLARLKERAAQQSGSGEVKAAIEAISTLRGGQLAGGILRKRLRDIFTSLGLDVIGGSVEEHRGLPNINEVRMSASPFGQAWLPPEFGSNVGLDAARSRAGKYTLLILRSPGWREKELVEVVRSRSGKGRAVIVLGVTPVPWQKRRQLARVAREERVTFLYADSFNLMFQALHGDRGAGRFEVWLATSLPLSWVNPYVTQGNVPPEMFVGRSDELRSLQDQLGSCFVYGGRQLGKSALLRAVRARAHNPEEGQVCIFVDLKTEGIGARRPIDALWDVIARELDEAEVPNDNGAPDRAAVRRRLLTWLEEDDHRRVWLLLDESDRFLEEEARSREFENVLALRELMDLTDRRCKVILAGLHSVTRFGRIRNQPLAQFGLSEPIGPLSWSDARYLVEVPMRAAGFRLEPPQLVDRVLVETRRHPSILQFVCRALIEHFSGKAAGRSGDLPVSITGAELDRVFDQEDLRERIRERFEWTLNLDPRYRVVALIMALRSLEDSTTATDGLPARELYEQSLAYWERGFASLPRDEFDVLLDEMVNLEVLARTAGRYRMPSTSVLRLLGDEAAIRDGLRQEASQDPLDSPSPERLRRALVGLERPERSPLTRGDERLLLEVDGAPVRVVFGTPATGVEQVVEALQSAAPEVAPDANVVAAEKPLDLDVLSKRKGPVKRRQITLAPWLVDSAETAGQQLRRYVRSLRDTAANERALVAIVDHRSISQWSDLYGALELEFEGEVRWLALKRWDTAQIEAWLDELDVPHGQQTPRSLAALTGGWPRLLQAVMEEHRARDRGIDEAANQVNQDSDQLEGLLVGLGLEQLPNAERYLDALRDYSYVDDLDPGDLADIAETGSRIETQQMLDALWLSQAASLTGERLLKLEPTVARSLGIPAR
jgi:hypothetical protein